MSWLISEEEQAKKIAKNKKDLETQKTHNVTNEKQSSVVDDISSDMDLLGQFLKKIISKVFSGFGILVLIGIVASIFLLIFPQFNTDKEKRCTSYETIKSINYVDGKYIAKTYGGYTFEVDNTKYKEGDSYCYGEYYATKPKSQIIKTSAGNINTAW